jgi:hypothetical protein
MCDVTSAGVTVLGQFQPCKNPTGTQFECRQYIFSIGSEQRQALQQQQQQLNEVGELGAANTSQRSAAPETNLIPSDWHPPRIRVHVKLFNINNPTW